MENSLLDRSMLAAWIDEANHALEEAPSWGAQWWGFGPPCCTFQLVVGAGTKPNIAIMLINTKYLAGPPFWKNQAIRVTWNSHSSDDWQKWEFILEDTRAGYRFISTNFYWAANIDVTDDNNWRFRRPTTRPADR